MKTCQFNYCTLITNSSIIFRLNLCCPAAVLYSLIDNGFSRHSISCSVGHSTKIVLLLLLGYIPIS